MILGVLQARSSSARLPNKVLLPILGKPMLQRQIERILRAKKIDKLVLATSNDPSDNPISEIGHQMNVEVYRGSLNDVLDRFYHAAESFSPSHIVRLTGDCPLTDPDIIDAVITQHIVENNDYTSNGSPPTFPDGLDVEVLTISALKKAWENAGKKSEREHVTLYLYNNRQEFKFGNYKNQIDLSHLRWTVDEPEDFKLIQNIYEKLYEKKNDFRTKDILELLQKHPELNKINFGLTRNAGLKKSIESDNQ